MKHLETENRISPAQAMPEMSMYRNSDKLAAPFISKILDEFESASIFYCILRSYEELPEKHGNDIDIFVSGQNLKLARTLLFSIADKLGWHKIAEVKRYGYNGLYFSPPGNSGRWLLVDLFTRTHWRGLSYTSENSILENSTTFKHFRVAHRGTEAAMLLVKELLPWGKVKTKGNAKGRIVSCIQTEEEKRMFIAAFEPCFGVKTSGFFLDSAAAKDWKTLESKVGRLRSELFIRSVIGHPLKQFTSWFVFLWGHIMHRIRKPLGIFVVILGPDGSGKTTISNTLSTNWKFTVPPGKEPAYIHGDFKVLPRLRILRELWARCRKREISPEPNYTKRHAGAEAIPHSLRKSICYLAYYYWGYLFGHLKVNSILGKDHLIVADRYFYDYFFQRGNMHLPHKLLRVLSWFIPRPNLVVVLEADPQAIYDRKPELTIQEIERQQLILREMASWLPNVVKIRSDIGIEETVQEIKKAMFSSIAKRNR